MARPRVLVLVMAGGAGGRLELLTDHRAKPAVPFGGSYRLIDFPLTNCLHSGIDDVWVVQQFHPASLGDHLANGRPWDLDRTHGGLMLLHPSKGTDREGWHEGTADALWRQAPLIREFRPDALVVVSADAVYRLDYDALVTRHLDSDATVTMSTSEVDPADAGRYGVVQVDGDRVRDYAYKPDEPQSNVVSNEVLVFSPRRTLDLLEEIEGDADEKELSDFGDALLPRIVEAGGARAVAHDGYWRDVGTVDAYLGAHLDLLGDDPAFELADPSWPIRTRAHTHVPARVAAGATLDSALLSPATSVAGTVIRSVLAPEAVVEAGAVVRNAVLLHGVRIRAGAVVENTVVDEGAVIGEGAQVGGAGPVTIVGEGQYVPPATELPPGARAGRE